MFRLTEPAALGAAYSALVIHPTAIPYVQPLVDPIKSVVGSPQKLARGHNTVQFVLARSSITIAHSTPVNQFPGEWDAITAAARDIIFVKLNCRISANAAVIRPVSGVDASDRIPGTPCAIATTIATSVRALVRVDYTIASKVVLGHAKAAADRIIGLSGQFYPVAASTLGTISPAFPALVKLEARAFHPIAAWAAFVHVRKDVVVAGTVVTETSATSTCLCAFAAGLAEFLCGAQARDIVAAGTRLAVPPAHLASVFHYPRIWDTVTTGACRRVAAAYAA